ncbi:integrase [Rhodopseudomonas sp. AAP120]|uniref:tyrosine-type recombinase/integrase n=1 Tax=Rhodopseudomonas sp. AAP120 TaxID=1523430 RepID=UPI0006B8D4CF|nr:tyrosine-type recombinase/integrase [Rhodopseudomonas sp. AAP120]KPF97101.1 integrase [Rhodopseudomonas sp. AAP120]
MNLSKSIASFLDHCSVERQLSDHTLQAYGYDLADFAAWIGTRRREDKVFCADGLIATEHLRAYLEHMTGRKLSASTVRRRLACLRSFFRHLEDRGAMPNPFDGWRLKLPKRKRLPRTLSRDETTRLLKSTRAPGAARHAAPDAPSLCTEIRLMIATGIRIGELCKIASSDVASDGAAIRIHGKGSRDRVVYVTDARLRTELRKLAGQRQRMLGSDGPLFVNRNGTKLRPHSFRTKLRTFAGQAGVRRRVTPHMLRHTAATLLIENGVDIRIVQRLLGHSSIATTEIYTHVSDEALRSTLERANILGGLAR